MNSGRTYRKEMDRLRKLDDPCRRAFANRLRMLRHVNHMSRRELADQIGVSYGIITAWELCHCEAHYESLARIAGIFEVTVDFLLGYSEKTAKYIDSLGL